MKQMTLDCIEWVKTYFKDNNQTKAIVGISGGKDSSVVAALCVRALGKENVFGLLMPCGEQADIKDSYRLVDHLGIEHDVADIGEAVHAIIATCADVGNNEVARTNLPARIRMATLFYHGQLRGCLPANTCNASEDAVGYATLFGDNAGCFAPIAKLTTEEIVEMGKDLGLPVDLVEKTPVDGLQPKTDEENLGFTYHEVNELIRKGIHGEHFQQIQQKYLANKFKTDIVMIPAFDPGLPNYLTGENIFAEGVDDEDTEETSK